VSYMHPGAVWTDRHARIEHRTVLLTGSNGFWAILLPLAIQQQHRYKYYRAWWSQMFTSYCSH
jgi:hypothetical protein